MSKCQPIKDALSAAEDAYHQLMLGQSVRVLVDQNGERVEFTSANAGRLAAYVADLRRQLAICEGTYNRNSNGPMRVFL